MMSLNLASGGQFLFISSLTINHKIRFQSTKGEKMGKQVNFYMLPSDESQFFQQVFVGPHIKIIRSVFPSPDQMIVDRTRLNQFPESKFYFWDTHYSLEKYIKKSEGRYYDYQIMEFVSTGEVRYSITSESSAPVIEYWRSKTIDEGILVPGRIWAEKYRLNDDSSALVYKGEEFERWYDGLAKWLRRNLKRVKGVHEYFGKDALDWFRSGGRVGYDTSWITWDQINDPSGG